MKEPAAPKETASSTQKASITHKRKIPTKHELCLALLIERGKQGINKLEALGLYGETCLNTTISELHREYGLDFIKVRETHQHQGGGETFFTRYTLKPTSLHAAIQIYARLKTARRQHKARG